MMLLLNPSSSKVILPLANRNNNDNNSSLAACSTNDSKDCPDGHQPLHETEQQDQSLSSSSSPRRRVRFSMRHKVILLNSKRCRVRQSDMWYTRDNNRAFKDNFHKDAKNLVRRDKQQHTTTVARIFAHCLEGTPVGADQQAALAEYLLDASVNGLEKGGLQTSLFGQKVSEKTLTRCCANNTRTRQVAVHQRRASDDLSAHCQWRIITSQCFTQCAYSASRYRPRVIIDRNVRHGCLV